MEVGMLPVNVCVVVLMQRILLSEHVIDVGEVFVVALFVYEHSLFPLERPCVDCTANPVLKIIYSCAV